ncbi:MAG TPA: gamma-glutamyltransferase family protein, partial [Sphingomicrobium sp.]|nr:gamma-glutamyltransferase family protein [Sphingomicrobium sp.]
GAEMLRHGGSAADAALATIVALTVVEPQSSGIGGGAFLVYSDEGAAPVTYDGREMAPMAAGPYWFFRDGNPMETSGAKPGGKSVGVPGNLGLMALAHRDQGRLPWAELFRPGIRLARNGFSLTPRLHRFLIRNKKTGALSDQGRALFYDAAGNPLPVGTIIRNPELAAFLEQLAAQGPDAFYVGPNAQAIVTTVNGARENPSQMALGDLASYEAKQRPAVCGEYRRHRICGMGPPASGGTTVFAIVKQLERFDLAALGPQSPTAWHLLAESMRLAFADRGRYLADPDFVPVPVAGLVDPAYLASRSALIAPDRTLAKVAAGVPPGAPMVAPGFQPAEEGTSHFVVVDRWGDVASITSTIEGLFGSGLVVNGYYLNNELTDFSFVPVRDGVPVANRVEPGKRPRSSMSPTIVYGPDGRVRLAVGAGGGANIIAQVARAIIGVIDWNLTAQQALELPVLFAPGDTVEIEEGSALEVMAPQLRALGHKVQSRELPIKGNAIEWRDGRWVGAADTRTEGVVVSE